MRKGIVMEQQHEYMVVMTNDGRFHRAENLAHAEVGMEVHFKTYSEQKVLHRWTQVLRNNHTKVAVMAIVFLLAFFPAYSWYGSNQAYAYMNIDINPSVELELNDKMQVLNITAQNEEAKEIVSELKGWKKKDASEVTFDVIHLSKEKGYVNGANQVLIGFSYLHSEYNQEYSKEIEKYLHEQSTNMSIATFLVPDEIRKQARDQKASVNEVLAERLREDQSETGTGSVPVSVEDDDKEIIQSFYNEDSSSQEDVQEEPGSTITPTVPMKRGKKSPHIKTPAKNKVPDHTELPGKGKKTAPGQKKKEDDSSGKARDHDKKQSPQEKAKGHDKKKDDPEKNSQHKSKGSQGAKEKDHSGKHKRKGQQKKSQINKQHDKKDEDSGGPSKGNSSNNGKNTHHHKREKNS